MKKRKHLKTKVGGVVVTLAILVAVIASLAAASGPGAHATKFAGTITIGASVSLTGATPIGPELDGYKLAVNRTNAAGGIRVKGKPYQVKLISLDNKSDNTTFTQQLRTLILQDKASALFGACCVQDIIGQTVADQLKVPMMETGLPVDIGPKSTGYTFLSYASIQQGINTDLRAIKAVKTNKKMLLVTNNVVPNSATAAILRKSAAAAGYHIVASTAVPLGTSEFSSVINQAKSAGAQVVFGAMIPPDCFAMWKQMKALKFKPKVVVGAQCTVIPGWANLGAVGSGTLAGIGWIKQANLPQTNVLLKALGRKYPDPGAIATAAAGFHAGSILMDALRRAGSTDREAIRKALAATNGNFPGGHVKFTGNKSTTPTYLGQWSGKNLNLVYPKLKGAKAIVSPPSGLK